MKRRNPRARFAQLFSSWIIATLTLLAFAQPACARKGSKARTARQAIKAARTHFKRGVQLSEQDNCNAAIVEFKASYKSVPRPNTLYNMGICHERLFEYDQALESYQQYLKIAPKTDPEYPTVSKLLSKLKSLLGELEVITPQKAEVWLGERKLGEAGEVYTVPAGTHVLEVRREGFHTHHRQIDVVSGERLTINTKLLSATAVKIQTEERGGISPVFFYIGLGATLAAAGVGAGFAMRTIGLRDEARQIDSRLEENQSAVTEKSDQINEASLIADLMFITAGTLAIGTVVAALLTDWGGEEKLKKKEKPTGLSSLRFELGPTAKSKGFVANIRGEL